jgi:hypothetical protein
MFAELISTVQMAPWCLVSLSVSSSSILVRVPGEKYWLDRLQQIETFMHWEQSNRKSFMTR